jgi:hypothetical protein
MAVITTGTRGRLAGALKSVPAAEEILDRIDTASPSEGALGGDVISEVTVGLGVTVDNLRIKDGAVYPIAGRTHFINLTDVQPGEGDILLANDYADAFAIRDNDANLFVTFVTTNSAKAVNWTQRLTTNDGVGDARVIGGGIYRAVAASAAITGTTETATLFSLQHSLDANTLKVGTRVRIRAQGIHTAVTESETHTMTLKIGSVAIATHSDFAEITDGDIFYFEAELICRTAGASGTIVGCGHKGFGELEGTAVLAAFALPSTTIDTTAANIIGVSIDRQATATDSDSARLDFLTVDVIG